MPSAALELFEEIMADPVPVLERMISENVPENEFLEFKGGRIAKDIPKSKEYFSETLSAFSNTSGGVLVFGIDARNQADDKTKTVNDKALVENVDQFRHELWSRRLQATTNSIVGLRVEAIKAEGENGYVVCYVPEGTAKPYGAEFSKTQYWMRSGDSNIRMPHAVARSMFYPQVQPYFSGMFWCRRDYEGKYNYGIQLTNTGNATAEAIFISCGFYGNEAVEFDTDSLLRKDGTVENDGRPRKLRGTRGIHPGETVELFGIPLENSLGNVQIDFKIYCRDAVARRLLMKVPQQYWNRPIPYEVPFQEIDINSDE